MLVPLLQWSIAALTLASLAFAVTYSFKSRRTAEPRLRALHAARMNIAMGLMLIFMALLQMVIFRGSSVSVIVEALFLLLGLFNLFSGIRNRNHYKRQPTPPA